MEKSQCFGLWKEHCGEEFPSLREVPHDILSPSDAMKVADYLDGCPVWIASPGLVMSCVNSDEVAGTLSLRTNGKWAWQDTMAHYVRRLRISPPTQFLYDIKNGHAAIPLESELEIHAMHFPDF